jgi:hypothetical protein
MEPVGNGNEFCGTLWDIESKSAKEGVIRRFSSALDQPLPFVIK